MAMAGVQKCWLYHAAFVAASNVCGYGTRRFAILLHAEEEVDFGRVSARFQCPVFHEPFSPVATTTSTTSTIS